MRVCSAHFLVHAGSHRCSQRLLRLLFEAAMKASFQTQWPAHLRQSFLADCRKGMDSHNDGVRPVPEKIRRFADGHERAKI